ncbi:MAG: peptidyl-prolyl cis-trans isomerase [Capsulimonadaceae bacterium]
MTRFPRNAVHSGLLLGAAALLIVITGCSHTASTGGAGTAGSANIAIVDGTPIPVSEFFDDMQCYVPTQQAEKLPVGQAVLNRLIRSTVLERIAKSEGAYPSDAQVDQALTDIRTVNDATYIKPYSEQLAESGMTEDFIRRCEVIPSLCQLNLVSKGLSITDRDIQTYYSMHAKDVYTRPAAAHVKRIVARSDAEVQQYYKQLVSGLPFDQVYKESTDRTLKDGEIPNWVPLTDTTDKNMKPVLAAVKQTPAGKFTPPIKLAKDTWWITYVVETRPAQVLPFDQAKSMARTSLANEKLADNPTPVNQFEYDLRTKLMQAQITVFNPEYDTIVTAMHNPAPIPEFSRGGLTPPPGAVPPGSAGRFVPPPAGQPAIAPPGAAAAPAPSKPGANP